MAGNPTPTTHQPAKSEMDEVIAIEATPDEIVASVLRGGAERQDPSKSGPEDLKPGSSSR